MNLFGIFLLCSSVALGTEGRSRFRRLAPNSELASQGEFPFIVSLQKNGRHICGGSLISPSHVLTAAHCVADDILFSGKNPQILFQYSIEVGSNVLGQGHSLQIKRIAHRKDYVGVAPEKESTTEPIIANDVAVITLSDPVQKSWGVGVAELPVEETWIDFGDTVTVAGWGSEVRNGPSSVLLKKTTLTVVSNEKCDNTYLKTAPFHLMCAVRAPGYGTCGGDSGGPVMHNKKLVAVVSGGGAICEAGNPNFFTEVSYFLPFIHSAMQNRGRRSADTEQIDLDDLIMHNY